MIEIKEEKGIFAHTLIDTDLIRGVVYFDSVFQKTPVRVLLENIHDLVLVNAILKIKKHQQFKFSGTFVDNLLKVSKVELV